MTCWTGALRFAALARRAVVAVLLALALTAATPAPAGAPVALRLLAVARLWGAVRYFDPRVAGNSGIDWDDALVDALPAIEAAGSTAEFAAVVERMLATLHDPVTHVSERAAPATAPGPEFASDVQDGIVTLRIADLSAFSSSVLWLDTSLAPFATSTASAKGIVFDLRVPRALTAVESDGIDFAFRQSVMLSTFNGNVVLPSSHSIAYLGLPPARHGVGAPYGMNVETAVGDTVVGRVARPVPIAVIVNERSEIPPLVLALIGADTAEWSWTEPHRNRPPPLRRFR